MGGTIVYSQKYRVGNAMEVGNRVMNADGRDAVRLTHDPEWDGLASYVPAAKRVAKGLSAGGCL